MEEAQELIDYLPISYKARSESEYIQFLWEAYENNYTNEKYEFSSLAFHLLYMSFVSFSIWQIRLVREQDFRNALIGFQSEPEMKILKADSPFKFYENLKESQIFRFLKLIGCQNEQVGEFSKFVKRRNKIAHPSGSVFFNDKSAVDEDIFQMMREVSNIQVYMPPIIQELYWEFLNNSWDEETREYASAEQEIEVNLIHRYYISKKDLLACFNFDLNRHQEHPDFERIQDLHQQFICTYFDPEDAIP